MKNLLPLAVSAALALLPLTQARAQAAASAGTTSAKPEADPAVPASWQNTSLSKYGASITLMLPPGTVVAKGAMPGLITIKGPNIDLLVHTYPGSATDAAEALGAPRTAIRQAGYTDFVVSEYMTVRAAMPTQPAQDTWIRAVVSALTDHYYTIEPSPAIVADTKLTITDRNNLFAAGYSAMPAIQ